MSEAPPRPVEDCDEFRASILRFHTLFAHAPFSVQLLDPDGRTLQVNEAWKMLWVGDGDPALIDYVLSGAYNMLADPQLKEKGVLPYLERAFAGESVRIPAVLYVPTRLGVQGRARWVRASAHPIKDEQGRVREVMLMHEDVTEHMEAEQAVRAAEERLRLATDAGAIGIWEWDMTANRVIWSDRVYELHGVTPESFDGSVQAYTALVHSDDRAMLWQKVEQAIEQKAGYSAEFRARLPDGGTRWLSTWARVQTNERGVVERLIGATISIDTHKRAEHALVDNSRRKDEFLAMLAHELRNPLAPISAAAQLLRLPGLDEQRVRHTSEVIGRQVGHMAKLIDDLMDVSRVTRGLVDLERAPQDLKAIVNSAIEQVRPLMEGRRHTLTAHIDSEPAGVVGDRTRLIQIVTNLLNNAAKYTPPGGEIGLRVEVGGDQVAVAVQDNGNGIAPDLLPHVFELFTQGQRSLDRSQGGLGIGLALVHSLVAMHGGQVEAHSSGLGQGSRFVVRLPLAAHPGAVEGERERPVAAAPTPCRIAVVDDNLDAGRSLALLLEAMGHVVRVFGNAADVLAAAEAWAPDVFILDIGLPDMDGYELARRLNALPALRHARMLALTGYGQPHDRARSKAAGILHHFVKPVDLAQLTAALGETPGRTSGKADTA
jgi:PAS domain S-box-containing protein